MQMVTRDMNRIACRATSWAPRPGHQEPALPDGDHQSFGDNPQAKNVHDMDSVIAGPHAEDHAGRRQDGERHRAAGPAPDVHRRRGQSLCRPQEFRVVRMGKKIAAGVQFIQTQCIYNMERWRKFMEMANDRPHR